VAFKVEEALKSSALSSPPQKNSTIANGFSSPEYSNPFATNLSAQLAASPWAGITTLEDVRKSLQGKYLGFADTPQTSDTFTILAESFAKRHAEEVGRVFEAWRPKVNGLVGFAESVAWGLQKAQESLRRWVTEAERQAVRRRALAEALLLDAYQACEALDRGSPEAALEFLRTRFKWRTVSFDHVTALWWTLKAGHEVLRSEMVRAYDPVGWLASRVAFRIRAMKTEFRSKDAFARATTKDPLTPPEAEHLADRALVMPESVPMLGEAAGPRARPRKGGMIPPSKDDPFVLVPAWHGDERQVLEEIAVHGRKRSRPRARGVLEYHDRLRWGGGTFDRSELLELVGGEDGLRAFRKTTRDRLMVVREARRRKKV
jgi:hypothetical protein